MTSIVRTVGGANTQINTSFGYDAANRLTTIVHQAYTPTSGGGTLVGLATYVYSYDNADRVATMVDSEGTYTYTYDNANKLTGVDENGSQVESYAYDLNGNRNSTGYTTSTGNEQTASPGATYTYDNAGNLISSTNTSTHVVTTYTYDYRNRLTEVTVGGTVVATYTYDALNRRIGIDDNGTQTWTVYDGSSADAEPYADFNGSGTLQEQYLFGPGVVNGAVGDEILARTSSGGSTDWYLPDKLGSVRDIVSSSGTELDHIVYDSFGNIVTESNASNGDRFKFAGMEYDSATGQYYDRARYYDPVTGTFTGQDPVGFGAADANLYRYVGNEPVSATDPDGTMLQTGGPIQISDPHHTLVFIGPDAPPNTDAGKGAHTPRSIPPCLRIPTRYRKGKPGTSAPLPSSRQSPRPTSNSGSNTPTLLSSATLILRRASTWTAPIPGTIKPLVLQ